jgi:hypothetical protein
VQAGKELSCTFALPPKDGAMLTGTPQAVLVEHLAHTSWGSVIGLHSHFILHDM